jgi:hypothetical protein
MHVAWKEKARAIGHPIEWIRSPGATLSMKKRNKKSVKTYKIYILWRHWQVSVRGIAVSELLEDVLGRLSLGIFGSSAIELYPSRIEGSRDFARE